ncbi:hypothetical protein MF672_033600 [Actinomadura sp. ATCC 31491]|uniref:Signal transduction histidine kinase subgroup 3 dimerisation and phosphoacceptor domain-containing protein n=1 Tax=Actinomadura luzonensis TaxID=2805427 RepID=A0ABT0G289_9ACTN|nr:hypothetical protein [Actinomadura luzonensis]MCK2218695.1 hypothetical protein [Actinomadura luzonensis]
MSLRSESLVRLAPAGLVTGAAAVLPLLQVVLGFGYLGNDTRTGLVSLAATAAYLPLHLRHVWYAAHAARPPAAYATLAVVTVIIVSATPWAGTMWPRAYVGLIVSALLVLPAPWSYVVYATVPVATVPVARALGLPWTSVPWLLFSVVAGSTAMLLMIWLAAALTRLRAAREALAQQAVTQERRRIDDDLRRTLGGALEAIAARGERAGGRLARGEQAGLADELTALADDSRRTLAEARQRVRGYRQPSLRAELETVATLLSAAGIETRLDLPTSGMPDTIAPGPRAALRATVTRLLRDDTVRTCEITVVGPNGRVRLELRSDLVDETIEVPA